MATERKAQQVVEFHLASARDLNQSRFGSPIGMTTSINAFELFGWLVNAPATMEPQAVSVLKKVLKPFLIRPTVEYYDRGLDQSVLFESDIFNLVTITQGGRPTLGEHLGPAIQDQDACQRNKPTGSAYLIRLSNFNMHGGPPMCLAAAFGNPAISLTGSKTDVAPNQPAPPPLWHSKRCSGNGSSSRTNHSRLRLKGPTSNRSKK
jgi:hypothetical protein